MTIHVNCGFLASHHPTSPAQQGLAKMSNLHLSLLRRLIPGRASASPAEVREFISLKRWKEAEAKLRLLRLPPDLTPAEAESLPMCLKGELLFGQGKDDDAMRIFQQAVTKAPSLADSHYGMSLVLAERKDLHAAIKHSKFAAHRNPSEARFHAQLGYCHLLMGNLQAAETPLRIAVRLDPNNPYAMNNFGIVKARLGDRQGAAQCFGTALSLKPDFAAAGTHLAALYQQEGTASLAGQPTARNASELHELEDALREDPSDQERAHALYMAYKEAGDVKSGLETLEAVYHNEPDQLTKHHILALAYMEAGDFKNAAGHFDKACALAPDDTELIKLHALALTKQEKHFEAVAAYRRALEQNPDDIIVWVGLATGLTNLCQYEEALAICERHIDEAPILSGCYGAVLEYLGRLDEAKAQFSRAIDIQPNDPNLRMLRGAISLYQEDFQNGWADYAFRTLAHSQQMRVLPFPEWRGEPIEGKTLIVLAEQGLGDQIMFASCLPDLLGLRPGKVVVEVIKRIAETLVRSFPECEFVATNQGSMIDWVTQYPNADYFVHIGDLPFHFRGEVSLFPPQARYLTPSSEKAAGWSKKIDAFNGPGRRPRIGISWRGGTATTRAVVRTLDVDAIVPLLESLDAAWVCLQYGDVTSDLERLKDRGHVLAYWPEAIGDLDDFAAIVNTLDLVITVCNTTVHYAGALGKPVWVMSPKVPEWRYGLHCEQMLWYPTSRMFRQKEHGDWDSVIRAIQAELSQKWGCPS